MAAVDARVSYGVLTGVAQDDLTGQDLHLDVAPGPGERYRIPVGLDGDVAVRRDAADDHALARRRRPQVDGDQCLRP